MPPSTDISNAAKELDLTLGAAATRPADERMEAATAAVVNESLMVGCKGRRKLLGDGPEARRESSERYDKEGQNRTSL